MFCFYDKTIIWMLYVGKKDIVAVLLPKKDTTQQPEDNFQSLSGSTSSESQPGTPSRGKYFIYSHIN